MHSHTHTQSAHFARSLPLQFLLFADVCGKANERKHFVNSAEKHGAFVRLCPCRSWTDSWALECSAQSCAATLTLATSTYTTNATTVPNECGAKSRTTATLAYNILVKVFVSFSPTTRQFKSKFDYKYPLTIHSHVHGTSSIVDIFNGYNLMKSNMRRGRGRATLTAKWMGTKTWWNKWSHFVPTPAALVAGYALQLLLLSVSALPSTRQ